MDRNKNRLVLAAALVMLLAIVAAPVAAKSPHNPFVGSWETFDDFVNDRGTHDTSHIRMQLSAAGQFNIRDDGASGCEVRDFGFVPATVKATGDYVLNPPDEFEFIGSGDGVLYCYPRDGRGRTAVFSGLGQFIG